MTRDWNPQLQFISWKANMVADYLAKLGLPVPIGFHVMYETNPRVLDLLEWDIVRRPSGL